MMDQDNATHGGYIRFHCQMNGGGPREVEGGIKQVDGGHRVFTTDTIIASCLHVLLFYKLLQSMHSSLESSFKSSVNYRLSDSRRGHPNCAIIQSRYHSSPVQQHTITQGRSITKYNIL